MTKGTVDENVYEIAKRKLVLDAAVLANGMDLENENDMSEKTMGEILSALLLRWSIGMFQVWKKRRKKD